MSVRAKMRCTGLHAMVEANSTPPHPVQSVQVTLQPVYATEDGDANKEWSRWTPSGQVQLLITNPEAHKKFQLGKTYFVDFTETPEV